MDPFVVEKFLETTMATMAMMIRRRMRSASDEAVAQVPEKEKEVKDAAVAASVEGQKSRDSSEPRLWRYRAINPNPRPAPCKRQTVCLNSVFSCERCNQIPSW